MNAALFGSAARGTSDAVSDFDVIAVIKTVNDHPQAIRQKISDSLGRRASVSIYTEDRLRELWAKGSPFAWHLYIESRPLSGYEYDFIKGLGVPADYTTMAVDITMMTGVLKSAVEEIRSMSQSLCFEAGLIYVASRNIGMYASKAIGGKFDFSRYSAYSLEPLINFPLTKSRYDLLVACRHASTRGQVPPEVDVREINLCGENILGWAEMVRAFS